MCEACDEIVARVANDLGLPITLVLAVYEEGSDPQKLPEDDTPGATVRRIAETLQLSINLTGFVWASILLDNYRLQEELQDVIGHQYLAFSPSGPPMTGPGLN